MKLRGLSVPPLSCFQPELKGLSVQVGLPELPVKGIELARFRISVSVAKSRQRPKPVRKMVAGLGVTPSVRGRYSLDSSRSVRRENHAPH